jgi:hypothetical protein
MENSEKSQENSASSPKKSRRYRLYITLDPDIHKRMNEYVDANGYDMSKLCNMILKKFLEAGKL